MVPGSELGYHSSMSKKSGKIAALIEGCRGQSLDAHYLGYFECFNRGLFYEAHDVLEELWLADRQGPEYSFYKGMIQLAGAFVHLQKNRLKPSAALFKLAQANLRKYPVIHAQLDLAGVLQLIERWLHDLESADFTMNPLTSTNAPKLQLLPGTP
jgi:predicted metal-dependent hydrolase